jgi:hypothetical protein
MVARMGTDGAAQAASRQPLPAGPAFLRSVSIGLNYCDRLRSLSIVYERFALCKDNCTQRVRGR